MNAHHRASFILATSLLGATTDSWFGGAISACVAGLFAVCGVVLQSRFNKNKGVAIQSAALTALANENARLTHELEMLGNAVENDSARQRRDS